MQPGVCVRGSDRPRRLAKQAAEERQTCGPPPGPWQLESAIVHTSPAHSDKIESCEQAEEEINHTKPASIPSPSSLPSHAMVSQLVPRVSTPSEQNNLKPENAHPMPSQGTQEGATAGTSLAGVAVDMAEAHLPEGRLQAADASAGRSRRAVVNIGRPRGEAKAAPNIKIGGVEGRGQVRPDSTKQARRRDRTRSCAEA